MPSVSLSAIATFIPQVCQAIIEVLQDEVLYCPTTQEEWLQVEKTFSERWNLPHCLGAIDGKHIAIGCPKNTGSLFHNYKGFFSIILLALVDGDYKYLWFDIGVNRACSDAQIFNSCALVSAVLDGEVDIPEPRPLPGETYPLPYFFVGDDAFALKTWLMKPFSRRSMSKEERIFNYRISRGRRVVENVFGITANRFRCLLTTMWQDPATVMKIVQACCTLHNLLRKDVALGKFYTKQGQEQTMQMLLAAQRIYMIYLNSKHHQTLET